MRQCLIIIIMNHAVNAIVLFVLFVIFVQLIVMDCYSQTSVTWHGACHALEQEHVTL
jgi:hypothetical protein